MTDFQQEDRTARTIDRLLLGAALLSLTFGVSTGLWSLLQ